MVTIKDKYLRILSCLVILVLGISLVPVASASAIPSIPNSFEGKVITGDVDVPAGTIISAYINSELAGINTIDEAGEYQLLVSGTEDDNGNQIVFKLGLVESPVSATYQQGAAPVKGLDLTFEGDFVSPVIESCSASPVYILNDGEDYSAISAKVSDDLSGVLSVTIDLTPIGGEVVPLTLEDGGIYTCNVGSTQAGEFKFALTATDYFGNTVTDEESISITVFSEDELTTRYGGADKSFSAEEITNIANNNGISSRIKYAILAIYFADGWDRI